MKKGLTPDVCQYLSQFIPETEEDWENFKLAFPDTHQQAVRIKKAEVLSRPVWIELSNGGVHFEKLHFEKPGLQKCSCNDKECDLEPIPYERVLLQKTIKDLF